MAACEKCWSESRRRSDHPESYRRILSENDCTPEEQAGDRGASIFDLAATLVSEKGGER